MPELVAVASNNPLLFKLLLVDMDSNCTRAGFKVHVCTASLPHVRKKSSFHTLIYVIHMFNEKIFCSFVLFTKYLTLVYF